MCLNKPNERITLTRFELKLLVSAGAELVLHTSTMDLDRYDVAYVTEGNVGKVTLCVDSNKFDQYELKALADGGVRIVLFL